AGRWVRSPIQMTFAIPPAIAYWLAGQSFLGHSISIGTVVAFTTLQTRLLFPIQSLLGVGADMEASLALFDRIFEYLDLPVDIVEAPEPVQLRPDEVLGEVRLEDVSFRYGVETAGAQPVWTLRARRRFTTWWPLSPTATRRSSASAATDSPAVRSSAWPLPAPCCETRRCWCSMRPPARLSPRPNTRFRPSWSGWPRAEPRSP